MRNIGNVYPTDVHVKFKHVADIFLVSGVLECLWMTFSTSWVLASVDYDFIYHTESIYTYMIFSAMRDSVDIWFHTILTYHAKMYLKVSSQFRIQAVPSAILKHKTVWHLGSSRKFHQLHSDTSFLTIWYNWRPCTKIFGRCKQNKWANLPLGDIQNFRRLGETCSWRRHNENRVNMIAMAIY